MKMNTEKRPVLCTTLYRKPMQPCNFDGILYQFRHGIFSHGFHQKTRFKRNFKKRPKSDFRQKSNFSPSSDALIILFILLSENSCPPYSTEDYVSLMWSLSAEIVGEAYVKSRDSAYSFIGCYAHSNKLMARFHYYQAIKCRNMVIGRCT